MTTFNTSLVQIYILIILSTFRDKQIPMLLEQHTEIVTGHNSTTVNEA